MKSNTKNGKQQRLRSTLQVGQTDAEELLTSLEELVADPGSLTPQDMATIADGLGTITPYASGDRAVSVFIL